MQPDNEHMDDLAYLSQQGFERVDVSIADLDDLREKVRARAFSYNNGSYFSWISLIIGVFLGCSVFFVLYNPPLQKAGLTVATALNEPVNTFRVPAEIVLDTVDVLKENFKRSTTDLPVSALPAVVDNSHLDTVTPIPLRDIAVSEVLKEPAREDKIKFIINAPVFYLHDLKITNYGSLYFKRNQFVRFNGTTVDYSNKEEASRGSSNLKETADYFLHEEIAHAMLYFKKGKYDQCINTLNLVRTFNSNDLNCSFYLGMCYYYKKNFRRAIDFLDACIRDQNNTFLQEAQFYKAMALIESGDKQQGKILLLKIAEEEGFYSPKAIQFIKSQGD